MKALSDTKYFYETDIKQKESLIEKLKLQVLELTEDRFKKVDMKMRSHDDVSNRIFDLNSWWESMVKEREKDVKIIKDHEWRIEELR